MLLDCVLVRHTGTIIRFRTGQLVSLPEQDRELQVELPNANIVSGHFRRNVANPNISGQGIVNYIKQEIDFGATRSMLIDVTDPFFWKLYEVGESQMIASRAGIEPDKIVQAAVTPGDIGRILALADRHKSNGPRIQMYARILRPPALRRILLQLMGASCQVEQCQAAETFQRTMQSELAAAAIVDVHHIEAVARRVDHHPRNLCVLCANHHRLFHNFGSWTVTHDGDDVIMSIGNRSLRIVRQLRTLGR